MWSRLEGTRIWEEANAAYAVPAGRHYHNFDHVLRLYEIAEERGLNYSVALDLAILAHDVVYDEAPEKERRSADWLLGHGLEFGLEICRYARALIMTTAGHRPGGDDRLVLLDLHDFRDLKRSLANRELLVREFQELGGIGRTEFLAGNAKFLGAMAKDIAANLDAADPGDRADWIAVLQGIRTLLAQPIDSKARA